MLAIPTSTLTSLQEKKSSLESIWAREDVKTSRKEPLSEESLGLSILILARLARGTTMNTSSMLADNFSAIGVRTQIYCYRLL